MIAPATNRAGAPPRVERFTPSQYLYLAENNMLGDGRTELIRGEIIRLCHQFDSHVFGVGEIADMLRPVFPKSKFWIRTQSTLACGNELPEPDVAVVEGAPKGGRTTMSGQRAILVVEVADTTLEMDLKVKPAIYAMVGIKDYWVLDLVGRRLIAHRDPVTGGRLGPRYKTVTVHDSAARIAALAAPKKLLRVAKMLP
jgi:Uma2 family endonuclease